MGEKREEKDFIFTIQGSSKKQYDCKIRGVEGQKDDSQKSQFS